MAMFKVFISGKRLARTMVEKALEPLASKGFSVSVSAYVPPTTRSARFSSAMSNISDGKSELESLRDELQEWKDNLPENLQSGSKADELDEAISVLEDIINNLDSVEGEDVSFPGMY